MITCTCGHELQQHFWNGVRYTHCTACAVCDRDDREHWGGHVYVPCGCIQYTPASQMQSNTGCA